MDNTILTFELNTNTKTPKVRVYGELKEQNISLEENRIERVE